MIYEWDHSKRWSHKNEVLNSSFCTYIVVFEIGVHVVNAWNEWKRLHYEKGKINAKYCDLMFCYDYDVLGLLNSPSSIIAVVTFLPVIPWSQAAWTFKSKRFLPPFCPVFRRYHCNGKYGSVGMLFISSMSSLLEYKGFCWAGIDGWRPRFTRRKPTCWIAVCTWNEVNDCWLIGLSWILQTTTSRSPVCAVDEGRPKRHIWLQFPNFKIFKHKALSRDHHRPTFDLKPQPLKLIKVLAIFYQPKAIEFDCTTIQWYTSTIIAFPDDLRKSKRKPQKPIKCSHTQSINMK